jgi:hypothetical protein
MERNGSSGKLGKSRAAQGPPSRRLWAFACAYGAVLFLDITCAWVPTPFLPLYLANTGASMSEIALVMALTSYVSIAVLALQLIVALAVNATRAKAAAAAAAGGGTAGSVPVAEADPVWALGVRRREWCMALAVVLYTTAMAIVTFAPSFSVLIISRCLQGTASAIGTY